MNNKKESTAVEDPSTKETSDSKTDTPTLSKDAEFWEGFAQSFILIFLAEIGDRTFIVVTLFSTKLNPIWLFILGSIGMSGMHILSVLIGAAFPLLLSKSVTEIICVVLFFLFGAVMIYQGVNNEEGEDEEAEVQKAVEEHDEKKASAVKPSLVAEYLFFMSLILCQEWGDKSQLAAIALASRYEIWGIIIGGCIAHILCILLALILGKVLKELVPDRIITLAGGVLFILFGIYQLVIMLAYKEPATA